jgi:hypothetical protein
MLPIKWNTYHTNLRVCSIRQYPHPSIEKIDAILPWPWVSEFSHFFPLINLHLACMSNSSNVRTILKSFILWKQRNVSVNFNNSKCSVILITVRIFNHNLRPHWKFRHNHFYVDIGHTGSEITNSGTNLTFIEYTWCDRLKEQSADFKRHF